MKKKPPPHELRFSAALHTLTPTQKRSLRTWLRRHLQARTNGHPYRRFYIVNPTGGLDPL